jgi:hypothetical protein
MIIYYTTVLPAVHILATEEGLDGVYVIEDSCIVAPNVTYAHIAREVAGCCAGIFGHAHHEKKDKKDWNIEGPRVISRNSVISQGHYLTNDPKREAKKAQGKLNK